MRFPRRVLIPLAILAGLLLVVIGVGIYGLLIGPPHPASPPPTPTTTTTVPSPPASTDTPEPVPTSLPETRNPERFAREVASVIFDWDTVTPARPTETIDLVLTVADPTGYETPGLYSDLRGYLPTETQWAQLRDYSTRQTLHINTITIPDAWAPIAADPKNEIADGTIALTIDGTRTRTGTWHGQITEKVTDVAFTVFLICPPAADSCHLLRLSILGTPLR